MTRDGAVGGEAPIHPVILSGGTGTRLWPLSRLARPKQLVSLTGDETMLQRTALRTRSGFAAPVVVAAESDGDAIAAQLAEIAISPARLILEPSPRNTAAAIALAAVEAPDDGLLLVMPSDHEIADPAKLRDAVAQARGLAEEDWVVTFGVEPDRPETGYGYIRLGEPLAAGPFAVERFAEKPDEETAAHFLAEGGWCWNAGLFLFRAGAWQPKPGGYYRPGYNKHGEKPVVRDHRQEAWQPRPRPRHY